MKETFAEFVAAFVITLVAAAVVMFLWGLVFHGVGEIDWATAFLLPIIMGIVLSWLKIREQRRGR